MFEVFTVAGSRAMDLNELIGRLGLGREKVEHALDVEALLLLFGSERDVAAVPVDPEGPDCIVATKEMAVRDLIEEEVLLAIPYAPRHEACKAGAEAAGTPRTRPFADLRTLLGTKH